MFWPAGIAVSNAKTDCCRAWHRVSRGYFPRSVLARPTKAPDRNAADSECRGNWQPNGLGNDDPGIKTPRDVPRAFITGLQDTIFDYCCF